jgi:iron(III) transport system permease protein
VKRSERAFTGLTLALFALLVLPPLLWLLVAAVGSPLTPAPSPLADARAWRLLARSVAVALMSAGLALLFGAPYGLLVARARLPARGIWVALGAAPLLLPSYAAAIAWLIFLGRTGPLAAWLARRGFQGAPFFSATGMAVTCWTNGMLYWPLAAGFALLALRAVPPALEETARLEVSPWRALLIAARPTLIPALGAATLLVFLLALTDFGVPSTFDLAVYPVELFAQFSTDYDTGAAVRLALPLVIVALPLSIIQHRAYRDLAASFEGGALPRLSLGRLRYVALTFCSMLLLLSVGIPLGVLVAEAGAPGTYLQVMRESGAAAGVSLATGGVTAALAVAIALPLALLVERRLGTLSARGAGGAAALATVGYALPGALIAVALIALLNRPGALGELTGALYSSAGVLIAAYLARFFPFAFQVVAPACRRLDPALMEAAALDGASPLTRLLRVALPATRGALAGGAALVFLLSARELDATLLLHPPGYDNLAMRIYDLFHYGPGSQVAALSVLTLALCAVVIAPLLLAVRDER